MRPQSGIFVGAHSTTKTRMHANAKVGEKARQVMRINWQCGAMGK